MVGKQHRLEADGTACAATWMTADAATLHASKAWKNRCFGMEVRQCVIIHDRDEAMCHSTHRWQRKCRDIIPFKQRVAAEAWQALVSRHTRWRRRFDVCVFGCREAGRRSRSRLPPYLCALASFRFGSTSRTNGCLSAASGSMRLSGSSAIMRSSRSTKWPTSARSLGSLTAALCRPMSTENGDLAAGAAMRRRTCVFVMGSCSSDAKLMFWSFSKCLSKNAALRSIFFVKAPLVSIMNLSISLFECPGKRMRPV
mmetsp:Transcript_12066/g.35538  ORF Transcript_12066/g.35538 Transcript_12066/m.35538 type:complete len:255 (-) Transcript_12066:887-1651(-)